MARPGDSLDNRDDDDDDGRLVSVRVSERVNGWVNGWMDGWVEIMFYNCGGCGQRGFSVSMDARARNIWKESKTQTR